MTRGRYFPGTPWLNIQAARVVEWRCLFGFPTKNAMKHSRKRRPRMSSVSTSFQDPTLRSYSPYAVVYEYDVLGAKQSCITEYTWEYTLQGNRLYVHITCDVFLPYIIICSRSARSRKYNEDISPRYPTIRYICHLLQKSNTHIFIQISSFI